MSSSVFLPKTRSLIGRLDRSANQRPFFLAGNHLNYVLTLISEKSDFSGSPKVRVGSNGLYSYTDTPTGFGLSLLICFAKGWSESKLIYEK